MPKKPVKISITKTVLDWAIKTSGIAFDVVAERIGIAPQVLNDWVTGADLPTTAQFRQTATVLNRQPAVFFLPDAPKAFGHVPQFRHPPEVHRAELNELEQISLREAKRLQSATSWSLRELGNSPVSIIRLSFKDDIESAANLFRESLGVTPEQQVKWAHASHAFHEWRAALENIGFFVMTFSMGNDSCRGFSLWDDYAPIIAINTTRWNSASRIFTIFHEYAHLATRTDSFCMQGFLRKPGKTTDPAEKWCEEFAAAVLLPWDVVTQLLESYFHWSGHDEIVDLRWASYVANKLKVSLRATVLRFIGQGVASWDLYRKIPDASDQPTGGGGGGGRDRKKIAEDSLGRRTISVMIDAVHKDLMTRSEALGYLDIPYKDLVAMEKDHSRPS